MEKTFKTTTVQLCPDRVEITVTAGARTEVIPLPVDIIPAELSLQFAGALAASSKILAQNETAEND